MPESPEIVKARQFTMQANPDAVAGQANETFMLTAKDGQAVGTGGEKVGFAKYVFDPKAAIGLDSTNPAKYMMMNNVAGSSAYLFNNDNLSQPEVGDDRGLLTRSVASTAVDRYLGTNVVAEERFGVDSKGRTVGISVQADGAGITGKYEGKNAFLEVNYSDPDIQRGLSDLEVNDYLTGQIDRHGGNIFIDTSGTPPKVTGIDNDLAFPEMSRDKVQTNEKWVKDPPMFIHRETAEKIMAMDVEDYGQMLKNLPVPPGVSPLSDAAINEAKNRLVALKAAIESGESQVVDEFNEMTFQAAVAEQEAALKEHLLDRDQAEYAEVEEFGINDVKPEHSALMAGSPKTSYVGTAVIQKQAYDFGVKEKPAEYVMRPGDSTTKAGKDLVAAEKNAMRADPSLIADPNLRAKVEISKAQIGAEEKTLETKKGNAADTKKEIDAIKAELAALPGPKGGLLNLRSDHKLNQQKNALEEKLHAKVAVLVQLDDEITKLTAHVEQREAKLDDLVNEAHAKAQNQALDEEKVGAEQVQGRNRSNAVSEGSDREEQPQLEPEERKNELSEDEIAELQKSGLARSESLDSGEDLGGIEMEEIKEAQPKPELQRKLSNRDLMAAKDSNHNNAPALDNANSNRKGAGWQPVAKPDKVQESKIKLGSSH